MSNKTRRERRNHDDAFKAKVAIEAIKEASTISELATKYAVHPNQIRQWKAHFLENAASVFGGNKDEQQELQQLKQERELLHQQIGLQTMDIAFLKKAHGYAWSFSDCFFIKATCIFVKNATN